MVFLLLVIVQFAVYFHLRAVAQTAARHGVDQVRVTNGTPAAGIAATNEFLDQSADSLHARTVDAERTETDSSVQVTGTVVTIIPGLTLTIDVTVHAPSERLTP